MASRAWGLQQMQHLPHAGQAFADQQSACQEESGCTECIMAALDVVLGAPVLWPAPCRLQCDRSLSCSNKLKLWPACLPMGGDGQSASCRSADDLFLVYHHFLNLLFL